MVAKYAYFGRAILEVTTPIKVSSGEKDIETDSYVLRDANGLPYIPGTSLAGVFRDFAIRYICKDSDVRNLFGDQSQGSRILVSDAVLCGWNESANALLPVDGLLCAETTTDFLKGYASLPIRQHVRISGNGIAEKGGKFDEQVVFKGSRFCFEIRIESEENGKEIDMIKTLFDGLDSGIIRIGGGTRKGFGAVKVILERFASLDLKNDEERKMFLEKDASLAESGKWRGWKPWGELEEKTGNVIQDDFKSDWSDYSFSLTPESFFLCSSGFSTIDADMAPLKEPVVVWSNSGPSFKDCFVIPATSLKGALAHRIAFWYNMLDNKFADAGNNVSPTIAVKELFGYVDGKDVERGNVLLEDIFLDAKVDTLVQHHVAIDAFSGGAKGGALFQEEVAWSNGSIPVHILVKKSALKKENVKKSLELALQDLKEGRLPLGGGVARGNGTFVEI